LFFPHLIFPHLIFISAEPRISWRAAGLDFRILFSRILFFPHLIFAASYFYCGRPSEPASGRLGGCLEACKGRNAVMSSISASYFFRILFFPHLIFIWADPRISWRTAGLDFRILISRISFFLHLILTSGL